MALMKKERFLLTLDTLYHAARAIVTLPVGDFLESLENYETIAPDDHELRRFRPESREGIKKLASELREFQVTCEEVLRQRANSESRARKE